jgi:hypothetical protein
MFFFLTYNPYVLLTETRVSFYFAGWADTGGNFFHLGFSPRLRRPAFLGSSSHLPRNHTPSQVPGVQDPRPDAPSPLVDSLLTGCAAALPVRRARDSEAARLAARWRRSSPGPHPRGCRAAGWALWERHSACSRQVPAAGSPGARRGWSPRATPPPRRRQLVPFRSSSCVPLIEQVERQCQIHSPAGSTQHAARQQAGTQNPEGQRPALLIGSSSSSPSSQRLKTSTIQAWLTVSTQYSDLRVRTELLKCFVLFSN